MAAPRLAKTTPPFLHNVLPRERLYRLLDSVRDRALIWIAAPAGAGKTTLVASWTRGLESDLLWYQCDELDGDIASVFHYLSVARATVPVPTDSALPQFSPDLYPSAKAFARAWFRVFFAHLGKRSLVVFDNWQELPDTAPLRDCLPAIVEEVPPNATLIVISRQAPDRDLDRALNSGRATLIGWPELQLTRSETAALAALYEPLPGQHVVLDAGALHEASYGWAAGVAVLLRYGAPRTAPDGYGGHMASQALFDHLANEVFDGLPTSIQDFTLRTACLEEFSVPVARELADEEAAEQILQGFVQRNVFTIQRPASGTYEYHPLLKAFLRQRIERSWARTQQNAHWRRAAAVLERHGQAEAAVPLWLAAEAWHEALRLLLDVAPQLARHGRFKTLADWLLAVPERERRDNARALYWLGACDLAVGSPTALRNLTAALERFEASGDLIGQMLSTVELIRYHQTGLGDFASALPWLDRLDGLLSKGPEFPSTEIELRVISGFVGMLALAQPESPKIERYRVRARRLIDQVGDVHSKADAVANLLSQQIYAGDSDKCRSLAPVIDSVLARDDLAPTVLAQILLAYAYHKHLVGERAACAQMLKRALDLLQMYGITYFEARIRLACLQTASFVESRAQLGQELLEMERALVDAPLGLRAHLAFLQQTYHLAGGEVEQALSYCARQRDAAAPILYRFAVISAALGEAEAFAQSGRFAQAVERVAEARGLTSQSNAPMQTFYVSLVAAYVALLKSNLDECRRELSRAFALGHHHGYASLAHGSPALFMKLVPVALEHGIQVDYCHYLIRKRELQPPAYAIEHWPWPIRIYALGRFEAVVDGRSLTSAGRSQRRPLELLQALLTDRAGLSQTALIDHLWPDIDGDAARNALDLALLRLRRLLGQKDTVMLKNGRLSLDSSRIWVDSWAVQTLCEEPVQTLPNEALRRHTEQLLRTYRGHFLPGEEDAWSFTMRDRLRSQLGRHICHIAEIMEQRAEWEPLRGLLTRALELDPVNEEFHRLMLRCLATEGRHAECVAAYRRCQDLLANLLGTEPSDATRSLLEELLRRA
jgi:LuxR family transcriptional regulator, maltose regulon positive regulatory protein